MLQKLLRPGIPFEEPPTQKPRPSRAVGQWTCRTFSERTAGRGVLLPELGAGEEGRRFSELEAAGKAELSQTVALNYVRCGHSEQCILQSCGNLGGNTN